MLLTTSRKWLVCGALGLATLFAAANPLPVPPQEEVKTDELARKAKVKVSPVYPDVARRMSIVGTVKLAVVVGPNGAVKSAKPVGGHPLLVNAAMDAMKQWKFETGPADSSGVVEFKFQPRQ